MLLEPGGGSMVGAIGGSTQREPLVVGKPSTFMMDYLANKYGAQTFSFLSAISGFKCSLFCIYIVLFKYLYTYVTYE